MNYKLAKQLKEAGYPQQEPNGFPGILNPDGDKSVYYPTLSELIEACGSTGRWELRKLESGKFEYCHTSATPMCVEGDTSEEAVAKLWLALHRKSMIEHKYRITLKDTQSGDTRTFEWTYPAEPDELGYNNDVSYLWEEGNYCCDCNRSIFLWPGDESKHLECETGDNRIELVELELLA